MDPCCDRSKERRRKTSAFLFGTHGSSRPTLCRERDTQTLLYLRVKTYQPSVYREPLDKLSVVTVNFAKFGSWYVFCHFKD